MTDKGKKAISKKAILINQYFHAKCEYAGVEKFFKKRWHEKDNEIMANAKEIFLYIFGYTKKHIERISRNTYLLKHAPCKTEITQSSFIEKRFQGDITDLQ
jgi:hypothetical protein